MTTSVLRRAFTMTTLVVGVLVILGAYRLAGLTNPLLCYLILALLLAGTVLRPGGLPFTKPSERPYWVLFLVLLAASAPNAITDRPAFGEQLVALVTCLIWTSVAVSLAGAIRTNGDLWRAIRLFDLLGMLMVASVLLGALATSVLGFEFGETVDIYGIFRVFGPLGDQVGFAIVPVTVAAIVAARPFRASACVAAVFLTGTRGAMVAVLVGLLWAALTSRQWFPRLPSPQRRRIKTVLGATIVVLGIFSLTIGGYLTEQLENPARSTSAGRQAPISLGIELAERNPALGVGFLGFRGYAEELDFRSRFMSGVDTDRGTYTTQNQLVQTATDAGVPGVIALAWLVLSALGAFRAVRRAVPDASRLRFVGLEAGFVGAVIGNQSAVWLLPTAPGGFVIFVLCAIAWRARALTVEGPTGEAAPVRSAVPVRVAR